MNSVVRFIAVPFVLAASLVAAGCTSHNTPGASSDGRVAAQVVAPCADAELHESRTYTQCTGGHVDQREVDTWCCADGSMPTTDSLIAATGQTCAGAEAAATSCTNHDVQVLEDCSNETRTDAARKCDNAGCHYSINYDYPKGGCTVSCVD